MPQVLVWKSAEDGMLFEDRTEYTTHLRKLARARSKQRKIDAVRQARVDVLDRMCNECKNATELVRFIQENWATFQGIAASRWMVGRAASKPALVNIKIDLTWCESVSNTHDCPKDGVTNWAGLSRDPVGYPGWHGRLSYTLSSRMSDGFGSDYFSGTPLHTGTGGGSGLSLSYDLRLFASDFPAMHREHQRVRWINQENETRARNWRAIGGTGDPALVTDVPEDWVCPVPRPKYR